MPTTRAISDDELKHSAWSALWKTLSEDVERKEDEGANANVLAAPQQDTP